jgi:hypothetical protein
MDFGRAACHTKHCAAVTLEFQVALLFAMGTLHGNWQESFQTLSVLNTMTRVTYVARVDPDVRYDQAKFEEEVSMYLSDPDGWESRGYTFEEVERNPQVRIHLSSPNTIRKVGCEDGTLSCAELGGHHLHLNAMRWTRGSAESKLPLDEYRQYMVTHEMGHILGFEHVTCPGPGQPAPLMMQQTRGIGRCVPNTKLTPTDTQNKQKQ